NPYPMSMSSTGIDARIRQARREAVFEVAKVLAAAGPGAQGEQLAVLKAQELATARGITPEMARTVTAGMTFGGTGSSGGGSPMDTGTANNSDDERPESSSQARNRSQHSEPITGSSST